MNKTVEQQQMGGVNYDSCFGEIYLSLPLY